MGFILAILAAIPNWLKLAAGGLVGAFLLVFVSYAYGRHEGRQQAAVSALETSVRVLKERNQIDATISHSDAAALCNDFGLPDDQRDECLRRLETPPAKP